MAETISGIVVSIADGDTLMLLDAGRRQHKIGLTGIDAPESLQAFGQKSRAHLGSMVFNRTVTAECGKTDKYQRRLCKILVDGGDVNLEQIKAGMAWWYRDHALEQPVRDREDYEVAEFKAKSYRLGLWSDKNPLPPWKWRR
jgi:endonuclease YncB( thermonuclease family)